jgi:hypothetical protein
MHMIGAWVGRAEGAGGNELVNDSRTPYLVLHRLLSLLVLSSSSESSDFR